MLREDRRKCITHMDEGVHLLESGDIDAAITKLMEAASFDLTYFGPWFNVGLAYKRRRDWPNALDSFLKSWTRFPMAASTEQYAAVLWNVGISASAMTAWRYARRAWLALGHPIRELSDEPPSLPMGLAYVAEDRNSPILGRRIDPARVELLERAARDHHLKPGVVVVHDAERIGTHVHERRELPIFPVLEVTPGATHGAFAPSEDAQLPAT